MLTEALAPQAEAKALFLQFQCAMLDPGIFHILTAPPSFPLPGAMRPEVAQAMPHVARDAMLPVHNLQPAMSGVYLSWSDHLPPILLLLHRANDVKTPCDLFEALKVQMCKIGAPWPTTRSLKPSIGILITVSHSAPQLALQKISRRIVQKSPRPALQKNAYCCILFFCAQDSLII